MPLKHNVYKELMLLLEGAASLGDDWVILQWLGGS